MFNFLRRLFETGGFMPHGMCYRWDPGLIRLHLLSDLLIGLSYVAISLGLVYFVRRARNDIPFSWIFLGFGVFILACGATHFMEVWTLWTPVYWLSGAVKVVTASASVVVAIVLPPLLPKSLALIRSAGLSERRKFDLEAANDLLRQEISQRKTAEEEVRRLNLSLEETVRVRTTELAEVKRNLTQMTGMVRNSSDAVWTLDLEASITGWNAAAERLFGYRAEEVVGSSVSILAPVGRGAESADLFARMRQGEPIASYETVRVRKDGGLLHVYLTLAPIRNLTGEIQGASVLASDITERRRSEEMFRMAVDAAPNAMIMADASGKIVLVNAQAEKLFGYTREELVGSGVDMLIPKKYREAHPGYRADFMREPRARAMGAGRGLYGLRKDGSEFPVEIGLNPIKTEQGMLVLSAIVDITERRRSEEMFRIAVDAAPNAMVMVDAGGKIVMVNTQTETLFGYTREELIGSGVEILIPQRYRGAHPAYRLDFMREPLARSMGVGRDLHGVRKDGSEFPVEIGLNPIKTERGTLVLSAIIDITQRKHVDAEIKRLNLNLERGVAERTAELTVANAELESFSYSVAHDLRAPLRQIAGFSRIVLEECGPEISNDTRRYLQRIQDGSQHMGNLVDDLLLLAKVSRQTLSRRPTLLNEIVDSAIESLQPDCAGREIRWEIDPLWTAHCDPPLVAQVFVNLLSNAVKFTRLRDSAVIHIGQTGINGQRVIFVRDNGAGFDMAHAGKLFGVFQRLHKPAEFEGTGIGLANVQRIVHKHGGRIWAEAAPDQGATFFLTLPDAPLQDAYAAHS